MRTAALTVLAIVAGLVVGFVLLDLVGIVAAGRAVDIGIGELVARVAIVFLGLGAIVGIALRARGQQN